MTAGRMAVCADPEGALFSLWEAKDMPGATVVNEAGSLNFNGLATRDVAAAKQFYGSVFGWTTLDLGGGMEMWTLPGYGDDLERDNPEIRKMVAESGGPSGFEDVVASINPIGADQPDTPAHWSVTFADRRCRRHRGEGDRARRHGGRPAARRSLGADDGHQRSRAAPRSSPASSHPRTRISAARRRRGRAGPGSGDPALRARCRQTRPGRRPLPR
jgi:catechol 2,3-dioxygenase-like lactoylglutathione lyase family enzyme